VPLGVMKRYDESVAEARRGLEVDPLSIPVKNIVGELISTARQWPRRRLNRIEGRLNWIRTSHWYMTIWE
jgi:hypothetical protein